MQQTHVLFNARGRFWHLILQISRDLIPAAYKNEKNFP